MAPAWCRVRPAAVLARLGKCAGRSSVRWCPRGRVLPAKVLAKSSRRRGNSCSGAGRVVADRTYTVDIPAGVDTGATLRLSGRGAAGQRGAGFGDLYVRVRVLRHDRFQRDGDDLVTELAVPMTVASLGGELELETLEGTEIVLVEAGTQTGKVFKLRGHGVPSLKGGRRGDIRAIAVVMTPEKLSDREEELLREFAALRGDELSESRSLLGRIRSALS